MQIPVHDVIVGDRVRQFIDDEIRTLCQSIDSIGQLQPILIDQNKNLICGARRLRACELLGREVWAEVVDNFDDVLKRLRAEQDENTCRKPFTPSEMVAMGQKIEAIEKPKAEERKKATQAKPGEGKTGGVNFSPPENSGKSRDKVAKALGVSGPTYDKAKAVVAAASKPDASHEVIEAARQMDMDGKVDKAFKVVKAAEQEPVIELPDSVIESIDLEPDPIQEMREFLSQSNRVEDIAVRRFSQWALGVDDIEIIHAACRLWVKQTS